VNDWQENPNESEGFKAVRKAYKAQGAELQEVKNQLAELLAEKKSQNVYEALANRGLDPRVAKFYPKDAATDDSAVDAWVTENGELFGNRQVVTDDQPDPGQMTEAEMRGYQILKDTNAYQSAVQMDLKSRLDKIQYDPSNPEKAQNEVMQTLRDFEGAINT
jgi:hypothetical protein